MWLIGLFLGLLVFFVFCLLVTVVSFSVSLMLIFALDFVFEKLGWLDKITEREYTGGDWPIWVGDRLLFKQDVFPHGLIPPKAPTNYL